MQEVIARKHKKYLLDNILVLVLIISIIFDRNKDILEYVVLIFLIFALISELPSIIKYLKIPKVLIIKQESSLKIYSVDGYIEIPLEDIVDIKPGTTDRNIIIETKTSKHLVSDVKEPEDTVRYLRKMFNLYAL